MDGRETDTGLACRLAHEHLPERPTMRNEVLNRLPRDFWGSPEELCQGVKTDLDGVPSFRSDQTVLAQVYRKVLAYQWKRNHHQPPSRLERLTNMDSFHAKRVICELLKAWACAHKDVEDDDLDVEEVTCYQDWVEHLLLHYDRWVGKLWSTDDFCGVLVAVHEQLADLRQACQASDRHFVRVMERLHDQSAELCDHALRVVLLGVADNHQEMDIFCQQRGPLSLRLLSQREARLVSRFWCTEFGQVVDAAIARGDPTNCLPEGAGDAGGGAPAARTGGPALASRGWSVWTLERGSLRATECGDHEEAERCLEASVFCAVLVGPSGRVHEKVGSSVLGKVMGSEHQLQVLRRAVDRSLSLRRAAAGLPPRTLGGAPGSEDGEDAGAAASRRGTPAVTRLKGVWDHLGSALGDGLRRAQLELEGAASAAPVTPAQAAPPSISAPSLVSPAAVATTRRPGVGDRVRVVVENEAGSHETPEREGTLGRVGVVVEDDHSDQPYNVDLGDRRERWYKEDWVQFAPETQKEDAAEEAAGTALPKFASTAPLPASLGSASSSGAETVRTSLAAGAAVDAPERLCVDCPSGQHSCAGLYELSPGEVVNGCPVWRHLQSELWICSLSTGRWGIGGQGQGLALVLADLAHDGAMPDELKCTWQWWDADHWVPDEAIAVRRSRAPGAPAVPGCHWEAALGAVRARWNHGQVERAGVAEPYRGYKTVQWREGVLKSQQYVADLPSLILELPRRLSELLRSHEQVMGAVRGLMGKGGAKEALAAIYALRRRNGVTGQLKAAMDAFAGAAAQVHGVVRRELFRAIEQGSRLKGQTPAMQRLYFESYAACLQLRDGILTDWHQLGLHVSDSRLAEEFERIGEDERKAYHKLIRLPLVVPLTALGDADADADADAAGGGAGGGAVGILSPGGVQAVLSPARSLAVAAPPPPAPPPPALAPPRAPPPGRPAPAQLAASSNGTPALVVMDRQVEDVAGELSDGI